MTPPLTGIHHVSLLALNLERTVQFYVDVLGLCIVDPVLDDERSAPDRVWLADDRSRLTLRPFKTGSRLSLWRGWR
jgi:catechol 2,3-dioxygenase-like lactoylglutathione lyase family enzyme